MMTLASKEYLERIYKFSNKFKNFTFPKDEVIVLDDSFMNEPSDEIMDGFFEYVNSYKFIIFAYSEHWNSVKVKDLVVRLIDAGKCVLFSNFTFGYEHYLRKYIKSDNLFYIPLENTIYESYNNTFIQKKEYNLAYDKTKLLLYFTYNRAPHKDYVIQLLKNNNLIDLDGNLITYHNFIPNVDFPITLEKLSNNGFFYKTKQELEFIKQNNIDMEFLSTYQRIIDSENFNIQNQQLQRLNLQIAHSKSMFNIISEACSPIYSNDENDVLNYFSNISGKTIFPILFENVFHITPKNHLYESALKQIGFEFYFESDEEFLKNLNESYYYSNETQSKIKHNKQLLISIIQKMDKSNDDWIKNVMDSKSIDYTYEII